MKQQSTIHIIMSIASLFVTLLIISLFSSIIIPQISSTNANLYNPIPDPLDFAKQAQNSIFSLIPPHFDAKINSKNSVIHTCNSNNGTNNNCLIAPEIHPDIKSKSNNSITNFKNKTVGTILRNSILSGNPQRGSTASDFNPQRGSTASDFGLNGAIPKGIDPPVNLLTKCDSNRSSTNNNNNNNDNSIHRVPSLAISSSSIMSMATTSNNTNNTTTPNTTTPTQILTPCIITGSYGPDIIIGPSRSTSDSANGGGGGGNVITGGRHNDVEILRGLAGNDIILCGAGSSCIVTTGPGDSILRSGSSAEAKLYGGIGNNVFIGGDGDSLMVGNLGTEQFYAGTGHDTMIGGPGRNYFDCGLSGNAVVLNYNPLDTKSGNCKYIVYQKTPFPVLP